MKPTRPKMHHKSLDPNPLASRVRKSGSATLLKVIMLKGMTSFPCADLRRGSTLRDSTRAIWVVLKIMGPFWL